MNVDALFDKLVTDLADAGVEEVSAPADPTASGSRGRDRALTRDGREFARLRAEQMSFLLPPGAPGLPEALALESSVPAGDGRWVEVPAEDASEWETLARRALSALP